MHLLVTGAAGFIGSHLVDSLLRDGRRTTGVDNFDAFYERSVKQRNVSRHKSNPNWQLIEADIRDDRNALMRIDPPDVIVHLAAKAGVRPSIENPIAYQEANVKGTQNLLEYAKTVDVKRFIFASSSSVYGVNPRVPWSEDDHVLEPISPYASTKVSGELLGHVYSHLYGVRFIALRFFTVYGPRQRPDLAIHKFARMISEGHPIPVFGDGSTRRDYTYIEDIVSGIRAAIDYDKTQYEVVNLGNNQTVSLNEMIEGLEEAMGVRADRKVLPEQPGDVPQTWANIEKARRLFGYAPTTPYSVGVRKFVEWFNEVERARR